MFDYIINDDSFNEQVRREFNYASFRKTRTEPRVLEHGPKEISYSEDENYERNQDSSDRAMNDAMLILDEKEDFQEMSHAEDNEDKTEINDAMLMLDEKEDSQEMSHTEDNEDKTESPGIEFFEKIFKLLLKHKMDVMVNNIDFMSECIMHCDSYYLKSIVDAGYNGNHDKSYIVFKKILEKDPSTIYSISIAKGCKSNIKILLNNGFCRHIQSVLMHCIQSANFVCMDLFMKYGANYYSLLYDIQIFVRSTPNLYDFQILVIKFALKNMCEITMLSEPIHKYFLIKSTTYDGSPDGSIHLFVGVPTEIFIYIMQLYIEIDYACINDIQQKLLEYDKLESESEDDMFAC